jgi:hypothetical protein
MLANVSGRQAAAPGFCPFLEPEASQRHAGEAEAKFLQCRAARDRLGHRFG